MLQTLTELDLMTLSQPLFFSCYLYLLYCLVVFFCDFFTFVSHTTATQTTFSPRYTQAGDAHDVTKNTEDASQGIWKSKVVAAWARHRTMGIIQFAFGWSVSCGSLLASRGALPFPTLMLLGINRGKDLEVGSRRRRWQWKSCRKLQFSLDCVRRNSFIRIPLRPLDCRFHRFNWLKIKPIRSSFSKESQQDFCSFFHQADCTLRYDIQNNSVTSKAANTISPSLFFSLSIYVRWAMVSGYASHCFFSCYLKR